jgi:hypothetical protein
MKRFCTIGLIAVALLAGAARTPAGGRVAYSVRNMGRQLHAQKTAQAISPIERLVLSLASTT